MADDLVAKKLELLAQQKLKAERIHELLCGMFDTSCSALLSFYGVTQSSVAPGGFNEVSRKTCKNLDAAITASKRPGYFAYYEQPDETKNSIRSGEVQRLQEQVNQLQKQIDQLSDKIDHATSAANASSSSAAAAESPNVQSLKQWLNTYGSPSQTTSDRYTSFTPDRKVYGGTAHYSAFKSQSSTMKKGRLTK